MPASVTAFIDGNQLDMFPVGDVQYAAVTGISIWAAPGPLTVSAVLRDRLGRVISLTAGVSILPAEYPVEDVTLPPDREGLLDPDIGAQEWAHVSPFLEPVTPVRLWEGQFISPTIGWVTSLYGGMRSYNGASPSSYHSGLDIANVSGTLVVAPAAGRVVLAEKLIVRGNTVIIDHGWGVHTSYFHMSALEVEAGDLVKQGQVIGRMGSTGLATGSHLHWEVRVGMIPVDPQEWLQRAFP